MAGYEGVMNKAFQAAIREVQRGGVLNHQQRVTRLYRASLRCVESWAFDRQIFCAEAIKIRAQFDQYKNLDPTSAQAARLLREGEAKLAKYTHPDPYVLPYMPGGSSFMRNPAPPLNVVFPEGVPPEADIATQDIHYVQQPLTADPEGQQSVLVDMLKKNDS